MGVWKPWQGLVTTDGIHGEIMDGTKLEKLQQAEAFLQERGHIFRSRGSFDWFFRKYRQELTDAGAIIAVGGQRLLDPEAADRVIIEVGRRAASRAR